jgi:hypothetical protein
VIPSPQINFKKREYFTFPFLKIDVTWKPLKISPLAPLLAKELRLSKPLPSPPLAKGREQDFWVSPFAKRGGNKISGFPSLQRGGNKISGFPPLQGGIKGGF